MTLNEANTFAKYKHRLLKSFANNLRFKYFKISLSGEYDYHVAILSKLPFKKITIIKPLMRAGILAVLNTSVGEVAVISTHLTPYTEDLRLPKIQLISKLHRKYRNKILMGDLNSLSIHDNYSQNITRDFNEMQTKKFTTNGELRFDAIKLIESFGYVDCAVLKKKNNVYTAPTSINEYGAHTNMRLDYIFVSKTLEKNVKSCSVIKSEVSENASDHYPVCMELVL